MNGDIFGLDNLGAWVQETRLIPAPGAASFITTSAGFVNNPIGCVISLTTDGTVGNRRVFVRFYDLGFPDVVRYYVDFLQAPSVTVDYQFLRDIPAQLSTLPSGGNDHVVMELPFYKIRPGMRWEIGVDNIQAADQLSQTEFTYFQHRYRF